MVDYPPLKYMNQMQLGFKQIKINLLNFGCKNIEKLTAPELLDFMLSQEYLNRKSTHKYRDINTALFQLIAGLYGSYKEQIESGEINVHAEIKDGIILPVILEEWSKSKQVYKPDKDFASVLMNTSKLEISRSMINHLPCKLFYIDTMDCDFGDVDGIFVYIHSTDIQVFFNVFILTKQGLLFSFYLCGIYNDKDIVVMNYNNFEFPDFTMIQGLQYNHLFYKSKENPVETNNVSRKDISLFALQMIAYLSIEEPQITESDLTKNTYKPVKKGAIVKNKWSEVKIDDVGVRYGNAFRKQIEIIKKDYENDNIDNNDDTTKRKSPTPHFRAAHWHKYWVGKGRTELRVKWIEPVFVGNSEPKNVIIHKIKNE